MAAGEFLPPVVTRLTGDIGDLRSTIAEAKALIASLDGKTIAIKVLTSGIDGPVRGAIAQVERLKAAIGDLNNVTISIGGGDQGGGPAPGGGGGGGFGIFGMGLLTWLKLIHYGLMIFGAQIISDTIGIVAFGAAAVATLSPVFSAVKNLGAAWNTFSGAQKVAATHLSTFLNGLGNHDLQVVTVFDQAIQLLTSHMKGTGGIVDQAANAFLYFERQIAGLANSSLFKNFLGAHSGTIQTDMQALFTLVVRLAGALISLAHNFNFLGLWALSGIGMVLKAFTWLNTVNPALARVAILAIAAYHAFKLLANSALGMAVKSFFTNTLGGVAGITGAFRNFQQFGLVPTLGFMTGMDGAAIALAGTFAGVALGVGILVGGLMILAANLNQGKTATQKMVASMTQADKAAGTNIAGYQKLSNQLGSTENQMIKTGQAFITSGKAGMETSGAYNVVATAQHNAAVTANTLRTNLGFLEQTFGLTQMQALQVAKRLGLLSEIGKRVFSANQRADIRSYMNTLRQANNPLSALRFDMAQAANATLGLTSQIQGLQNAFNVLAAPFANTVQATVTWKDGNIALAKAVKAANGQVGYSTAAQRAAAGQLSTSITNTIGLSNATLTSTHSFAKAKAIVEQEIGVLRGLHSQSGLVKQALGVLEKQLAALKSKTITITANIVSSGSITVPIFTAPGGGVTQIRHASGAQSARAGLAWVGELGPELIRFKGGERVYPNHISTGSQSPAAAGGGGVLEAHIYLDGREIHGAVKRATFKDNVRNSNRARDGRPRGTMVPRPA